MDFSSILRDISIIIASWTAIYSIDAWRREFKWKRRAELAEEVLTLFYEAQDAIRHIRNPFAFGEEGKSRKAGANETAEQKNAYDKAYVAFERYQNYQELFSKLHSLRYRFMVYFEGTSAAPFDEIRTSLNEILFASRTLGSLWLISEGQHKFRNEKQEEKHFEKLQKYESILWLGLPEEDNIEAKVTKSIIDIEKTCRGVFLAPGLSKTIKCKKQIGLWMEKLKAKLGTILK